MNKINVGVYMREKIEKKTKYEDRKGKKKTPNIPSCFMTARGRMMQMLTMMIR